MSSQDELYDFIIPRLDEVRRRDWEKIDSEDSAREFISNFCKYDMQSLIFMLGYRDIGKFHISQIHDLSQVWKITDEPVRRLWLWSRGFFKTSLITEAHSIFLIVNNPNIRMLPHPFLLIQRLELVMNERFVRLQGILKLGSRDLHRH